MTVESVDGIWWCMECDTEMSEDDYINHKKDECNENKIKIAKVKEYKKYEHYKKYNKWEFACLDGITSPDYYCLPYRVFVKQRRGWFHFEDKNKANKRDILRCFYCNEPAVRISHYTREGNKTTCFKHLAQRHINYIKTGKIDE